MGGRKIAKIIRLPGGRRVDRKMVVDRSFHPRLSCFVRESHPAPRQKFALEELGFLRKPLTPGKIMSSISDSPIYIFKLA